MSRLNTFMAAHQYWRLRILADSGFYSNPNHYLNLNEVKFYDATLAVIPVVSATCNNYFTTFPPINAFDGNYSTLVSLDTNVIYNTSGGYAWIAVDFGAPVNPSLVSIAGNNGNCPTTFAIDYSDDNVNWTASSGTLRQNANTGEPIFPTGNFIAGSPALSFYYWRVRITTDTGSVSGGNHYFNIANLTFIDDHGNAITPDAYFGSPTIAASPASYAGGTQGAGLQTNGLHTTPPYDCYIGVFAKTAFAVTKVRFSTTTGDGYQDGNFSFVVEGSNDTDNWITAATYTGTPASAGTLMDFAVQSLNTDMTFKKITELAYSALTPTEAKDAVIPISGIGDTADTLYRLSLSDLAGIMSASDLGIDYHKEHRGWRIMYGQSVGTGNGVSAIGDLTFIDRAGNIIPTTGGYPYSYNGNNNGDGTANPAYGAAKAFDSDPSTIASSSLLDGAYINPERNYGVGYIFPDANDVGSVKITPANGFAGDAPQDFAVQYSDDAGITWTTFSSYQGITNWATGVPQQFYLPSVGVAVIGIGYGRDFWRSLDFTTASSLFGESGTAFACSQLINGAVKGRRMIVEALVRATNGAAGIALGLTDASQAYKLSAQSDGNWVLYNSTAGAVGNALGSLSGHAYTGYYHFRLEVNMADIVTQQHSITAYVNGQVISTVSSTTINLQQNLKVFAIGSDYTAIQWCRFRWDDNSLDIPTLGGTDSGSDGSGGSTGGSTGTGNTILSGSPSRYYRIGGFVTSAPQANEIIAINSVADAFMFQPNFEGSTGKALTAPTGNYVCSVKQNGTQIGTITVLFDGTVQFTTISTNQIAVAAGDVISITGAATTDTQLANFAYTLVGVTSNAPVYLGARLQLSTTTPDLTGNRIVNWDVEDHDTSGFFSSSQPDRFVVPAGITRVRLVASVQFNNADAGATAYVAVLKNSTDPNNVDSAHLMVTTKQRSDFANVSADVDSGVLSVVEGDYFNLVVNTGSDTTAGLMQASTFFSIEAVDGTALFSGEPDVLNETPIPLPSYRFAFYFETSPLTNERIGIHIVTDNFTFADNFAGSQGYVDVGPLSTFVMFVKQNNVQIGTISVATNGGITFDTSGATVSVAVGDRISLHGPTTADTNITGGAFTFKGTYTA